MSTVMTWVQTPGGKTCRDSAKLDGQKMKLSYWLSVMMPGNKAAQCKGECDCELNDSEAGSVEDSDPYLVAGSAVLQEGVAPAEISAEGNRFRKLRSELKAEPIGATDAENFDTGMRMKNG